jgi:glycosyltransferase involved in cell wall biosynthesis
MYKAADLVVDQLLLGWYGGFAVEAMAMGKPVGAYIREEDLRFIPAQMRRDMPLLRLHPETLVADIERAIAQRSTWPELGRQSRMYVEKWHHPLKIARAVSRIYRQPKAPLVLADEVDV